MMFGYGTHGGPLVEVTLLALIMIWPLWRIFGRAGFHPALSLLVFIPGLGWLIMYLILAFATWPAVRNRFDANGEA